MALSRVSSSNTAAVGPVTTFYCSRVEDAFVSRAALSRHPLQRLDSRRLCCRTREEGYDRSWWPLQNNLPTTTDDHDLRDNSCIVWTPAPAAPDAGRPGIRRPYVHSRRHDRRKARLSSRPDRGADTLQPVRAFAGTSMGTGLVRTRMPVRPLQQYGGRGRIGTCLHRAA